MITSVKVYSAWANAPQLLLDPDGRAETDLIQIRNIDGLDPVKGSINTSSFGSKDGASFTSSRVDTRNIVLTLHPNPDWIDWTFEKLRRLVYLYFMPKMQTRLVFTSDDIDPVEIYGYVESCESNPFSADSEIQVSIICENPYFSSSSEHDTSDTTDSGIVVPVTYDGDIVVGYNLTISPGVCPDITYVQLDFSQDLSLDSKQFIFSVPHHIFTGVPYIEINSIPGNKFAFIRAALHADDVNLLPALSDVSVWPKLYPVANEFSITSDSSTPLAWTMRYHTIRGGL